MNQKAKLARLEQISRLLRDIGLSKLQQTALERQKSLDALARLDGVTSGGADGLLEANVRLRYERWADMRRRDINLQLAEQTAKWLDAKRAARHDFGRYESLQKLSSKL
jgi:hypothetical protein